MVKPHQVHLAVVGEQFLDLPAIPLVILRVVADEVIRIIPITRRVIEPGLDPMLVACLDKRLHDVASVRRCHDAIFRQLRVELRKAVVVLADEHHVFHAALLGEPHPDVGVVFGGIELLVVVVVNRILRARGLHAADVPRAVRIAAPANLFLPDRARPPVDEHPELRVTEPLHPRVALLLGLVELRHLAQVGDFVRGRLRLCRRNQKSRRQYGCKESEGGLSAYFSHGWGFVSVLLMN